MAAEFTATDREFLTRTRVGYLTTTPAQPSTFPSPRPVWFELTDAGTIELFSLASSPKVRSVARVPRASLVAGNNMGEREYWVAVVGKTTVVAEGAVELAARLGARYWDLSDPERKATLQSMLDGELVKIVIEPETVKRYG
ncbi:pyridoxamine 5'-phosphate oxidase family protein [Pseudonocardia sp. GCM10023141]|uniref:pyridoxamine 5'-phosphate oxidase family protein n=1 Tax=Pseudonocardia sp. GCM10023141 TaxID=3252653 RepID=UPI00361FC52D